MSKNRFLVSKLGITESVKNGLKYTIFLFNDSVILAKKLLGSKSKSTKKCGILERKQICNTHELVFGAELGSVKLDFARKDCILELALTGNILFGTRKVLGQYKVNNPSKIDKFKSDIAVLTMYLNTENASSEVYHQNETEFDMYSHVYTTTDAYSNVSSKHSLVIFYVEDCAVPSLDSVSNRAVCIVQNRGGGFRSFLRYRGILCVSEHCFPPTKDFCSLDLFRCNFLKSGVILILFISLIS